MINFLQKYKWEITYNLLVLIAVVAMVEGAING